MTRKQWAELSLVGRVLTALIVLLLGTFVVGTTVLFAAGAVRGVLWMFNG